MLKVKTAKEFMRRRLTTLGTEVQVLDGVALLLKGNISGTPVVDEKGNYLGVFSEKCCINAMADAVEAANRLGLYLPRVGEFMTRDLVVLSPETDVFDAIDHLLERRVSGAPVVDREGRYQGSFSEKTAMQVVMAAIYDQVPGTSVLSYMDIDRNRIIGIDETVVDAAQVFQQTPYRRLPVLYGEKLAGQVSRRDVLRTEHGLASQAADHSRRPGAEQWLQEALRRRTVGEFMDQRALTKGPSADLLSIAQAFLNSPYRRLPIVEDGKLIGQVSRRDLLEEAASLLRPSRNPRGAQPLYLSSISDGVPPSLN